MKIPFNKPCITGREQLYISQAIENRCLSGNGTFSRKCAHWLEEKTGARKVILAPSGTAALEMMMILAGIGLGDEVIMPSFTFSSTANAVVLRGAIPVFIDIRPDTLNMNESLIEAAITSRTKAILPVHYAGVGCEMDAIMALAKHHNLLVLEDAAQCILSYYNKKHLGTFGQMSALSFHETKNIQCGEGGALLINDPSYVERAEIIMEKGTDRSKFFRGEIDKYTWVDVGSSFLVNEMTAAFLWAQLEEAEKIVECRRQAWNDYYTALKEFNEFGHLRIPVLPPQTRHNGHIFALLLKTGDERNRVMDHLNAKGVNCVFHYIPLHSARAGTTYGRVGVVGELPVSEDISTRLLRLPLWPGVPVERVVKMLRSAFEEKQ